MNLSVSSLLLIGEMERIITSDKSSSLAFIRLSKVWVFLDFFPYKVSLVSLQIKRKAFSDICARALSLPLSPNIKKNRRTSLVVWTQFIANTLLKKVENVPRCQQFIHLIHRLWGNLMRDPIGIGFFVLAFFTASSWCQQNAGGIQNSSRSHNRSQTPAPRLWYEITYTSVREQRGSRDSFLCAESDECVCM